MPGDLRDPEQFQPWHYDPKYDATPNTFDPGAQPMDAYLQSIAEEATGARLDPETLDHVKSVLDERGLFHQNPGDESFRGEVKKLITTARRIASRWQS